MRLHVFLNFLENTWLITKSTDNLASKQETRLLSIYIRISNPIYIQLPGFKKDSLYKHHSSIVISNFFLEHMK